MGMMQLAHRDHQRHLTRFSGRTLMEIKGPEHGGFTGPEATVAVHRTRRSRCRPPSILYWPRRVRLRA